MSVMECHEFVNRLEAWMDGERHADAEAHLRGCSSCRSVLEDLGAIHAAAAEMREVEPPRRVWTALRAQLEQEGIIRESGWRAWLAPLVPAWPRPALAAAYLAVMMAGAFLLGTEIRNFNTESRWARGTAAATAPIEAQLGAFELHTVSALQEPNPVVNASFHKNLEIVDNYIAVCEKSVKEEPQNELARDYLYGAYQQKADLLAEMSERGVSTR